MGNFSISTEDYLDRLLYRYAATFDIQKNFQVGTQKFAAYGYFYSHTEKYVLVREANLWSSNCFEHILFYPLEQLTKEHILQADDLIRSHMEPRMVRGGEKYPDQNHMYSYLTIVFVCDRPSDRTVLRQLKKYRFDKGYCFHMRGFSQARLIAVSMADEKVHTNFAGSKSQSLYREVFQDVRAKKPGYHEYYELQTHMESIGEKEPAC